MIKNRQKSTKALYDKKKELEELRCILNRNILANGFDYQELLAASRRMDEVILEYMKMENK